MVMMILILAIMANTIFSFIYIIVLCVLMYFSEIFLDVQKARDLLMPKLKLVLIPLMLVEVLL